MQTMIKLRIVGSFVDLEVGGEILKMYNVFGISREALEDYISDDILEDFIRCTISKLKEAANDPAEIERMEREEMMSGFGCPSEHTIKNALSELGYAFIDLKNAILAQLRNDINWIKDLVRRK